MIVEVFPAAGDPQHPLSQHRLLIVLDERRVPRIGHCLCHPLKELRFARHLPQQKRSSIGGDDSPINCRRQFPAAQGCKMNRL
jgi:hypothetical protein